MSGDQLVRKDQVRRTLVRFFAPVAGIIVTTAYSLLSPGQSNIGMGIAIGFYTSLLVHILAIDHLTSEKYDELRNEFISRLSSGIRVKKISSREADAIISKSFSMADKVQNTFINIHDLYADGTQRNNFAIELYKSFLGRSDKNKWYDITTYYDLYSGRFAEVSEQVRSGCHKIHVCDANIDFLNFTILEAGGELREMFFGWNKNSRSQLDIFYTDDRELMKMFADYFRKLQAMSLETIDVDYGSSSNAVLSASQTVKLIGTWVSITPISNASLARDYEFYSVIKIETSRRSWNVTIEIRSVKDNRLNSIVNSAHASLLQSRLDFYGDRKYVRNEERIETSGSLYYDKHTDRLKGAYSYSHGNWHKLRAKRVDETVLELGVPREQIQILIDEMRSE